MITLPEVAAPCLSFGRRVQSSVSATDGFVASTLILHMYDSVTGFKRVVTTLDLHVLSAYVPRATTLRDCRAHPVPTPGSATQRH